MAHGGENADFVQWPNDADFDPATLHDWPENLPAMKTVAERWAQRLG
jgi:hypothetical protein